jgi:branched-chain amino acid transport system substrate-binding protein
VEEINDKGGVLGRSLKLLLRDEKSSPEEGTKVFRELAAEGVLVVLGNVGSGTGSAVSPLARELKTPYFSGVGYSRFLTEEAGHRYFFRLITNDRVFGSAMAQTLAKLPLTKYCTIGNDFAYGRSITGGVMNRLKELKPEIEVLPGCEFWPAPGETDFTSYVTTIMAKKPDAVMFGGVVSVSSPAFIKQAKAFGVFDAMLGVHPSLGMTNNNWGLNKEDVPEGILVGADYPYPIIDTPVNRAFFGAYQKRWGKLPTETSAHAYTTIKLIAKAIEKAGKVDREALIDALEGMSIEHPSAGTITIRPFDHQSTQGWWMGYLTWDEEHSIPGMKDIWYLKGEPILPSEAEIQKLRAK